MSDIEAALAVIAVVVVAVFFTGARYGTTIIREEAVLKGYAIYCPDSGDFAWNNECGSNKQ